ncbi:MAG: phage major capsid protein, partial [Chloroflexota bacterium]|nr:phage major capsid protein [Chloroflexota bacterium]
MAKFQAEVDEKHKHNLEELGKVARQEKRDTHESGFEYNVEDVPTDGEIKNQAQSNAMLQKMVTTPAEKFYGKEEAVKELQRINDVTLISSRISKRHPRELDYFKHGLMKNSELAKALGSASSFSATGAEWVPTLFSNDFIARMEQEYVVANTIQTITIPSGTRTMKVPAAGAGIDVTTYTQNAGDNLGDNYATNAIGAATPASRNIELDPIKFAVRVELEEEAVEDMIVDVVEQITLPEMRLAAAKGLDDAIINGDADGTHQDADVQALGASDRRKAFDGLRKAGLAGSAKADAISGGDTDGVINITDIKTVLGAMKAGNNVYYDPDNLRLLCNLKVYIDLLTMTETLTRDKIGEALMTIDKGQLAGVMGIPIIRTELMRGDLD